MSESAGKKFVTFRDLREASRQRSGVAAPAEDAPGSAAQLFPEAPPPPAITPGKPILKPVPKQPVRTVSPTADFQKVPNSIVRQALSDGLFRGKSKQVWDYLWSVSRGAINPTRTVRRSRKDIKEGAGLGSMVTVDAALTHLTNIGLLEIYLAVGSARGNEYAIFTPEELAERRPNQTYPLAHAPGRNSYTSYTSLAPETAPGSGIATSIAPSASPFKPVLTTVYSEQETAGNAPPATANMLEALTQAAQELQGEIPDTPQEADNWRKIGDLLAQELKQAVARTRGVTSLSAFFAEHLRRTFAAPPKTAPAPSKNQTQKKPAKKNKKAKKTARPAPSPAHQAGPALSQYSFAECLRYAETLQTQGQSIKNPGGLATTLHRSGLADDAINRFLAQASNSPDQPETTAAPARMKAAELTRQITLAQECLANDTVSGLDELEEKYGRFIHPSDWQAIQNALQEAANSSSAS